MMTRRLLRAVSLALAFSVPTVVLAFAVRVGWSTVADADASATSWATDVTGARPTLRDALLVGQELLQARWLNLCFAILCVLVWRAAGLGRRAVWAGGTVLVAWGVANLAKVAVERARPVVQDAVAQAPGYSFPSGHTANATAVATAAVILLWPLLGRRGRPLAVAAAVVLVLVTGADRVLLGVHYPSDVVGGVLLASALVAGSAIGYLGEPRETPGSRPVAHPSQKSR